MNLVERKRDLCEEVLEVLQTLQPGATTRRGVALYELHISLLVLARQHLLKDSTVAKDQLKRSLECLQEALSILQYEPQGTFGAEVYKGGKESLPSIQSFVNGVV